MSYKVLFDGNGSNIIQVVGLGLFVPAKAHDDVMTKWAQAQAERDALAAQNEALRNAIDRYFAIGDSQLLIKAFEKSQQEHLAEIRAEAYGDEIRKGGE